MKQGITKVVVSKTETEAAANYDKMIDEMKAADNAQIEKVINENFTKRQELLK